MLKYNHQDGGDILGQGTYGLIIHPSLSCENPDYSNKQEYVSKIIDNKDLDAEYTQIISSYALNISSIDPESKYLVYPLSTCGLITDIDDKDQYKIKQYLSSSKRITRVNARHIPDKTSIIGVLNTHYTNVVMPKGEFDLQSSANIKKIPINNLAKGIINIILGTKKLSQNYITHRDIKPLNILYHNDTLKIIDFGLASDKSKMNISDDTLFSNEYMYWSLDYKIIEQFYEHTMRRSTKLYIPKVVNSSIMPKMMKSIYSYIEQLFSNTKRFGVNIDKILTKSSSIVDLTNLLSKLIKLYYKDGDAYDNVAIINQYKKCVHNLDTFSLAISIFEISEKSKFNAETKQIINEILKKYTKLSYLTRGKIEDLLVDLSKAFKSSLGEQVFDITYFERDIVSIFGEEVYSKINME